ncbi:MAG: hypothetical protein QXT68_08185 [Halobacteria archaeon]
MATTISVTERLKSRLERLKVHPRETYGEVIERMMTQRPPLPREELLKKLDRIRERNSGVHFESTRLIREMRDSE